MDIAATPTYHLWFKPTGLAYDVLARTIRDLARELGVPAFEPHVTLLAYLEGTEQEHMRRAGELAERLEPCHFVLTEPAYFDEYFRCLFLLVDPTPAVLTCHALAAKVFGKPDEAYMPHVSLVYGSLAQSRKKSIIAALPPDARTSFVVTSVTLLKSESAEPKDWHEIAVFPFRAYGP
jgi:2'-5' RNA ligase